MKNKTIILTVALLIISLGNYFGFISNGSTRTVEFISIFAIGALSGILLTQIIKEFKNKKD